MRRKVLLLALTSMTMSLCIPAKAQQSEEKIRGAFFIGFDSTLTVSKSWLEADNNHYDTTTFKLPTGLSVMELI